MKGIFPSSVQYHTKLGPEQHAAEREINMLYQFTKMNKLCQKICKLKNANFGACKRRIAFMMSVS
jgi:hypothetical protein